MRRAPLAALFAALLSLLALAPAARAAPSQVSAAPAAPGNAAAAPADFPAQVALDLLTPAVLRPDSSLRVTGRITNTSPAPLSALTVRLRVSRTPLDRRGQVADIAAGDDRVRTGYALAPVPGFGPDLLAPGATARFSTTLPMDTLRLPTFGIYVLGIEVLSQGQRTGLARTFLPYVPKDVGFRRLGLSVLWPLVDVPHRDSAGVFLDDSLAGSLRSGGRLQRLVGAGGGSRLPLAWVVDPMLLEDVAAMARGYTVRAGTGTTRGAGAKAAADWLTALKRATAGGDVYTLPYAAPDAAALTHAGHGAELKSAVTDGLAIATDILGRRPQGDLAWPVDGAIDVATGLTLRGAGAAAVVLRDGLLPPRDQPPYTPDGRADLPTGEGPALQALLYDERLTGVIDERARGHAPSTLARQRFAAETAMIVAERPSVGRNLLVAPPQRWDPPAGYLTEVLRLTRKAPWVRPLALASLRSTPAPDLVREPLRYPPEVAGAELPARYLAQVAQVQRDVETFAQILEPPSQPSAALAAALRRLRSSAYRGAGGARTGALAAARESLSKQQRRVRIVAGSVTLGEEQGSIPVTVVNNLDSPVTLSLDLTPRSPRLGIDARVPVTVPARRNRTVLVPARAVSNGLVPVDAQLRTTGGAAYGPPVVLKVRIFKVGAVGLYVTVAAAALLFARAAVTLVRRGRRARRSRSQQGSRATA